MKKIKNVFMFAIIILIFSACKSNESNILTVGELTDREEAILFTTSDQSFVFDYNFDDAYKEVSVWIEKYESGELTDDKLSEITTEIAENGSIILATQKKSDEAKQMPITVGISSHGSVSTINSFDTEVIDSPDVSSVSGSFSDQMILTEDEVVLAYIGYSSNVNSMSSLSTGFYENVEERMDELEHYDLIYLFKAKFNK